MERTVVSTASEEIDLYLRTIYSLLRTTAEVKIRTLEEVHAAMNSTLHADARKPYPDTSAFIYSLLRLPDCMPQVRSVVLGQSAAVFEQHGVRGVEAWQPVSARARRRKCYYNGADTLACFIASRSDIDDVIPTLTAYQIEWNKLHAKLQQGAEKWLNLAQEGVPGAFDALAAALEMPEDDLERLRVVWAEQFFPRLREIAARRSNLGLRLLGGSLANYWRATRMWWDDIEAACPELLERPLYFISSNTHSALNLLTGFALQYRQELERFIEQNSNARLLDEWREIQHHQIPSSQENFLYYTLKKYQQTPAGKRLILAQQQFELNCGIRRIESAHTFDVEAQVIDLSRLNPHTIDPRLSPCPCPPGEEPDWSFLQRSRALILNIDYPLGLAAYNILSKVAEHSADILGVYVMGKAATLNGKRGDIILPNVVQDEHSQNTYLFQNSFSAADVAPYLVYGTVLDNQKAVSVYGTFLQNARIMDVVYREGYTDIEMEAGPYLSAICEMVRPRRHPVDEIVTLYGAPFDIGIVHYVSDTPLSKGKNLGAGALSYEGMDSTYAATLAILRRIFQQERRRVGIDANPA